MKEQKGQIISHIREIKDLIPGIQENLQEYKLNPKWVPELKVLQEDISKLPENGDLDEDAVYDLLSEAVRLFDESITPLFVNGVINDPLISQWRNIRSEIEKTMNSHYLSAGIIFVSCVDLAHFIRSFLSHKKLSELN